MQGNLSDKYGKKIRPLNIEGVKGFVWDRYLLLEFLDDDEK